MKTTFFTGTGDKGSSKLGKKKVSKDNVLFDVLGTLDELNSVLGWAKVIAKGSKFKDIRASIVRVQNDLFIAQAEVAAIGMGMKTKIKITAAKTKEIEAEIAAIDKKVPPLKNFVIPGGSELATRLDVARATSRRLERMFVAFSKKKKVSPHILQYSNRLSSLLFALARLTNHKEKVQYEHPTY